MSRTRIGKLYHGLVGSFAGQPKRRTVADLDPVERSFRHIWRYVKFTSSVHYPPERKRPNLLVFQMGKVASLAIQNALYHGGINAFHCHELSLARQQLTIAKLLKSELTYDLASHELRMHIHNASLAMLVRWYQENKRYRGRKLKVVTLTRDPVSHYKSWFIQRLHVALPKVCGWQRARMGAAADAAVDQAQAVHDIVLEAASIIAAAGANDPETCEALARERWPLHPVVMEEVSSWLRPLTWFDTEILDLFGLDALAGPELRERGWILMENDCAEILVLRFEQLGALVPKIAELAGVQSLMLRERNVTERKAGAPQFLAAMQAAIDTPAGQAGVQRLRASPYARACGYDRPAQQSATS